MEDYKSQSEGWKGDEYDAYYDSNFCVKRKNFSYLGVKILALIMFTEPLVAWAGGGPAAIVVE